jgi:hypothetical protein
MLPEARSYVSQQQIHQRIAIQAGVDLWVELEVCKVYSGGRLQHQHSDWTRWRMLNNMACWCLNP